MGNVASIKTRLQKLEQYIAELKRQRALSMWETVTTQGGQFVDGKATCSRTA